jgi:hypothetical protein
MAYKEPKLAGDVTGDPTSNTVASIQGVVISGTPSTGQVLTATSPTAADWATPASGFTAGGDLTGTSTNQNVVNIHGASVPIAGSLVTGNVLQVSGASALSYGPVNLAGGSNYVTGTLPTGNQAAQSLTLVGDVTGSGTTASTTTTVNAIQGVVISGTAVNGYVLEATSATAASWQPGGGGGSGITQLTGDVTAGPGSGSQAATVASIQGVVISGTPSTGQVLEATSSTAASWQTVSGTTTLPATPGLRLSLTTATPVTTSDVTGATTLYYTPYTSGVITLYNGSVWTQYSTAEVSLALGTLSNATNYDVFANYSSGVVLSLVAWTNSTTRATALVRQDGMYVKSGATDHLYLGTITTTSTTTTEDSIANRYVYNFYNQTPRKLKVISSVNSWAYTTAAYRQADGSTANQFNYVCGDPGGGGALTARVIGIVGSSSGTQSGAVGVGIDSTTANSADMFGNNVFASVVEQIQAVYDGYPGIGKHTIAWLEYGGANVTFYGNVGLSTIFQAGMTGIVWQ